ncbi:MAG: hypothetical protein R3A51_02305 [Nannocystaceae bacterium]
MHRSRVAPWIVAFALAAGCSVPKTAATDPTGDDTDGGQMFDEADAIQCDPLDVECKDGYSCLPDGRGFSCQEINEDAGAPGDPCDIAAECRPGTLCMTGLVIAGCDGLGCCTPFCDLDEDGCGGLHQCLPYFSGDPPMGGEDIGVCSIPQ